MRTTGNTYLRFKPAGDSAEEAILVSLDSILDGGYPIDSGSGDDLELISNQLCDKQGNILV